MQCPNCGKTDNKVIDSRPSKDGIAIRQRRQCLICSSRYTTYEATEERFLPFLIKKKVESGTAVSNLKAMLSFISRTSKILSSETEHLIQKTEKHEKAQAEKGSKKQAREKEFDRCKAASLMTAETIFKIITRHKSGIDISKLKDKTSLEDKKLHNIVFKLKRYGKIKNVGRGVYVKA